jgi:hypothetical protein
VQAVGGDYDGGAEECVSAAGWVVDALVVLRGAIGLFGVGILVLTLRPVALFLGEERWVQFVFGE